MTAVLQVHSPEPLARMACKLVWSHLAKPKRATDCFLVLFKRPVVPETFGMALCESIAHLNCLLQRGLVSRGISSDGAWMWRAV